MTIYVLYAKFLFLPQNRNMIVEVGGLHFGMKLKEPTLKKLKIIVVELSKQKLDVVLVIAILDIFLRVDPKIKQD